MSILDVIMNERRVAVDAARAEIPLKQLQEMASGRQHHSLKARLRDMPGTHIIAEMKKASPSAGVMQDDYNPAEIAACYLENGAVGISVLTEPLHFLGRGSDVQTVRSIVDLPILRKDFMCHPYQIAEAAAWGADVILLIAAALRDDEMQQLYTSALEAGLDVLAEVHTREELDRVLPLSEAIVGVNSRNLKTLTTDLAVAHELAEFIPESRISIAESGIRNRSEIESLQAVGYDGFLIGEALVSHDDPGGRLKLLMGG
ncbi:MAG: indole-3-glycerol phosphate synthase TrpC [Verrucomicrobia bacterium]|jgi:indole-3-glycerol phosphate synthase|nr:indole-3-glycerol phosphate synthase TrpC [Verrucomicrobiota bacterium]